MNKFQNYDLCKNVRTIFGSFQMEANNITGLIEKGVDALKDEDWVSAKHYILQAIAGINNEKEAFLTGLHNDTSMEQQLADWYGGCSFILNKVRSSS